MQGWPNNSQNQILFFLSFQKTEEWEKKKTEADMEEYVWKDSASEKNILETLFQIKAAEKNTELSKEELLSTKEVEDYKNSVVSLKNEGDNENTLSQYKESVKRLLHLMWIIQKNVLDLQILWYICNH